VRVTQPLFQPDDGLAVGGEAEMTGLDDAGVDRPDRNLVQAFALGRQECNGESGVTEAGEFPRGAREAQRP
jgi:hypothetical protein